MIIKNNLEEKGFSINLFKDAALKYPSGIWENLSESVKRSIVDNLVYLKVSPYLVMHEDEFYFESSTPYLKEMGDKGIIGDMPRIAEEDNVSTKRLIEKFNNKKVRFRDSETSVINDISSDGSALIAMSFGKDSLLSYGIANEAGLNPKLAMVQDFWDIEASHKLSLIERFEKEFRQKIELVHDRIDAISEYARLNKSDSDGIVGANAMNAYSVMLLPLAIRNNSSYIVFGNEQNFNDHFINDEGFKVYPSYEQSSEWMHEQNTALSGFTNNQVRVSSFVEPIYNLAEVKVLFKRYPDLAKYQMSCSLLNTRKRKERWCYNCPMCAKSFLYLSANGVDPKTANFNTNLFGKEHIGLYPLFSKPTRVYEKPLAVRDEQLFAFYLAYRGGVVGDLIEKFKVEFFEEAKSREDELHKKFLGVHEPKSMSGPVKGKVLSILKEELGV
ncbi:MAG: hypothetical protein KKC75_00860 [Nanoarchaeota archaeon]|nr:hypothetical protein [Nanoarchaeota archaeon]MBU1005665.1 hypothetical protein [Nanoarchaeota archaeon]MBU1946910.1 hypothetical protein [Nanoarchaeota archaeon]